MKLDISSVTSKLGQKMDPTAKILSAQQKPVTRFNFKEGLTCFKILNDCLKSALKIFLSTGEKVKCFYGPNFDLYEAKIMSAEIEDQEIKYLVHYVGWKKTYNEKRTFDNLNSFFFKYSVVALSLQI